MSVESRLRQATSELEAAMSQTAIPQLSNGSKARALTAVVVGAAAVVVIALPFLFLDPRAPTGVATPQDALAAAPKGTPAADPPTAYVIDLNTGEMTPLPLAILGSLGPERPRNSPSPGQFAASPDGSRLAYVGTGNDGSLQIFIAGIDGTGVRQLTRHPTDAISPAWSPNGAMVAYEGSGGLFVLDVATGESTQVAGAPPGAWAPQFTPDGSSLLYTGLGPDSQDYLLTVPIDGGISTVLIGQKQGMGHAGRGSMSPDGSLVTMLGHKINGPGAALFLADTDGSEPRHLGQLHSGNCRSTPAGTWSPDGRRIVCAGDDGVLVVDVATGDASRVAEGRAAIWLDDHTLLVEG